MSTHMSLSPVAAINARSIAFESKPVTLTYQEARLEVDFPRRFTLIGREDESSTLEDALLAEVDKIRQRLGLRSHDVAAGQIPLRERIRHIRALVPEQRQRLSARHQGLPVGRRRQWFRVSQRMPARWFGALGRASRGASRICDCHPRRRPPRRHKGSM